jgi:hypothetical protein
MKTFAKLSTALFTALSAVLLTLASMLRVRQSTSNLSSNLCKYGLALLLALTLWSVWAALPAHAQGPVGETGTITLTNTIDSEVPGLVFTVTMANTYVDPVVVAFINTRNDDESVDVRVRNVTTNSFQIFMQEPDNGSHVNAETASYIVMEKGRHTLDGNLVAEAGTVTTDSVHQAPNAGGGEVITFPTPFSNTPAVLHTLNTYSNTDFMSSVAHNISPISFTIQQEMAEVNSTVAITETIGWIAFATGSGVTNGAAYEIGRASDSTSDGVEDTAHTITFSTFSSPPDVVVKGNSSNGADGYWARGAGIYDSVNQTVYAEEDQISDTERTHADETFAWAAFAPQSTLATPQFSLDSAASAGLTGVEDSSVAWGDYDNDGDLDILLTGCTAGDCSNRIARVYQNTDSVFSEVYSGSLTGVDKGSVAWGDYDNDGDLDILLSGRTSIARVYENTVNASGGFTVAHTLTGVGEGSSVAWGDYDNDGDLDIFLSGKTDSNVRIARVYQNTGNHCCGSGGFTDINAGLPGVDKSSVAWGDYDNDGDLDILLTGFTGSDRIARVYQNTALDFTVAYTLPGVQESSVAWGDYDNDGDLDILLTGCSNNGCSSRIAQVYQNTVNAGGAFTATHTLTGVQESSVAWGDYDNDGDLDILLSGNTGSGRIARVYENTVNASGGFTDISAGLPGVRYSSVAWGDYDNDGDLDILLTGCADGDCDTRIAQVYRNNNSLANTPPAAPTGLSSTVSGARVDLSWAAVTDTQTISNAGLTYNLYVGSSPGLSDTLAPMSCVGACGSSSDGYRQIPAMGAANHGLTATLTISQPGTYYWSVQAIDTAFAGSTWAAESSFTVEHKACSVEYTGDNRTDFSSSDATALQLAVDAAPSEGTIKVAGTCAGVQVRNSLTQTVYISQNLTIQGGYTTTDWTTSDPDTYPTTLDAAGGGRVVYISSTYAVSLTNLTLTGGDGSRGGGGNNYGGGIYANSGVDLIVTSSTITNNTAERGGGLFNQGSLTLTNSTLISNTVGESGWGGGLMNGSAGTVIVSDSTINNNSGGPGGGIFNNNTLTLTNSTVSGNTASSTGGGIRNNDTLVVSYSTIVSNTGSTGAGLWTAGTLTLTSSIIANNSGGKDCAGSLVDGGYNLIEDSGNACGLTDGINNNIVGSDPLLDPLADNGGYSTPDGVIQTHALQAGSRALDKIPYNTNGCGTTITTDQRGVARPDSTGDTSGSCDMGAYETFSFGGSSSANEGDGPGGVGLTDGSSDLELWLQADTISGLNDGEAVSSWPDSSGNSNDVAQGTSVWQPTFESDAGNTLNSQPVVQFDGNNDYLVNNITNTNTNFTFFGLAVVSDTMSEYDSIFSGNDSGVANSFQVDVGGSAQGCTGEYRFMGKDSSGSNFSACAGTYTTTAQIVAITWDGATMNTYNNGAFQDSDTPTFNALFDRFKVGISRNISSSWPNDIAEMVIYWDALNNVQRILVENYLQAKYNDSTADYLTIGNDVYDGDTTANGDFDLNVAGIGQDAGNQHTESHSAGIIVRNNTFLQDNGDWLLFGHRTTANDTTNADLPTSGDWASALNPARWSRHWYIDITDAADTSGGSVNIVFDFSQAGFSGYTPANAGNYRLLKRTLATGDFSDVTSSCGATVLINSDQVMFQAVNVSCLGSNFTLGILDNTIGGGIYLPIVLKND